jgi:hypothetical protein
MLGLTGQPRAITSHTYLNNGDQHIHVAWSRIDQEALRAIELPYFGRRLMRISRELEMHFGLEPVTNHRQDNIRFAPTAAEYEQARRLGLDIHEIRSCIRSCYDRSDCGASFRAALEHEGMTLAQGERRDFIVIDQAGGIHALGKRVLDQTAAKIRDRLSDIQREQLPTVDMVRLSIKEKQLEKLVGQERAQPIWDREVADRAWQEAVIKAALEKEIAERQAAEAILKEKQQREGQSRTGSRGKGWSGQEQKPDWVSAYPEHQFEAAAREATVNRDIPAHKELRGMSGKIMDLLQTLRNEPWRIETEVKTFAAVLDEQGIALAEVTKEEAYRSHRETEFAKAVGRYAPRFKENEIVAITVPSNTEYWRNGEIIEPRRVHKLDQTAASMFVKELGNSEPLKGIDATKQALEEAFEERTQRAERAEELRSAGVEMGDIIPSILGGISPSTLGDISSASADICFALDKSIDEGLSVGKGGLKAIDAAIDGIFDIAEAVLAPKLTPEQVRMGEVAAAERKAEANNAIDFSKYTDEMAYRRRHEEEIMEAARQREREGRER